MTVALDVVREPARAALLMDPLRRRLLEELAQPDSAAGLARRIDLPRQRLNYHLRELEKERLIELVEERRRGNCTERVYRRTGQTYLISPETLGKLGEATATEDRFSSAYQLGVAAQTIRELADLRARAAAADKTLATFTLQVDVRFKTVAARTAFAEELAAAVANLAEKHHDATARNGRTFRWYVGGYPAPTPA